MKQLQNCLYITKDGAYLHKQRETLLVEQRIEGKKHKLLQVPIHSIGAIFCFGNVLVSPQVMGFCGERGTGLAFFDQFGRFQARVVGQQHGNVLLRRAQYQFSDEQQLTFVKGLVGAKLQSSRAVLQRHLRNHGAVTEVKQASARLKQIIESLPVQRSIDSVRGYEGEGAKHYFSVFGQLITNPKFEFNGRNRRPPKDPINAMLSFLYAIWGKELSGALQGVGLDPQVGWLHTERPGRDSLAQDLLEEFRAYVIDRLVLTLVNRKQVKPKDFITDVSGAVSMSDEARKTVLQAYQSRKLETINHPFLDEQVEIGLLPHLQAMLLSRHIRGDLASYPPFCMR
ncbi:type I-C CRISPR-associated endonuclease Cas1c [Ferrimonas lipolytica]|uniref:CRISPR-associated endonuclease Cas1 n=1 Tax=Ferrimonas lipolytica TaxID=2724191 RepID=A0A6H1U9Q7_9GAMM|nr:type I-C CRISPR-associated endonuclease Cas1c [Ferrimonas lipolytica]QIZ75785.1 type I-C CRISPR-associated endonuclease Cas1 [Ferrimonas lipolytica]